MEKRDRQAEREKEREREREGERETDHRPTRREAKPHWRNTMTGRVGGGERREREEKRKTQKEAIGIS